MSIRSLRIIFTYLLHNIVIRNQSTRKENPVNGMETVSIVKVNKNPQKNYLHTHTFGAGQTKEQPFSRKREKDDEEEEEDEFHVYRLFDMCVCMYVYLCNSFLIEICNMP